MIQMSCFQMNILWYVSLSFRKALDPQTSSLPNFLRLMLVGKTSSDSPNKKSFALRSMAIEAWPWPRCSRRRTCRASAPSPASGWWPRASAPSGSAAPRRIERSKSCRGHHRPRFRKMDGNRGRGGMVSEKNEGSYTRKK